MIQEHEYFDYLEEGMKGGHHVHYIHTQLGVLLVGKLSDLFISYDDRWVE